MGSAGLEIVCVIEWPRTSEENGGTTGVEEGVGEGKSRDVQRVEMWVCMAVDLCTNSGCDRGEKS